MNVLHLPTPTAGNAWSLAQGERRLGIDAKVLYSHGNPLGYPADEDLALDRYPLPLRLLGQAAAFLRVRSGYDAYHFNFGSSLLNFRRHGIILADLPYYSRSARKVFTFNGCDARQKYPTMRRLGAAGDSVAACFRPGCYGGMCNSGRLDEMRRRTIDKAARHGDHLFAVNPDLLHFLPAEKSSFLPYAIAAHVVPRRRPFFAGDVVRIVHAPTNREAKGTDHVLKALAELKDEFGSRVETVLVENTPHAQALQIYADADLFVDQLLVGWYGGVAVEVMHMGIPVASFVRERDLDLVPPAMRDELPLLRVDPFTIGQRLREFVRNRDMAYELGRRGRAFAARWHDPARVARLTIAAYRGETPAFDLLD